MNATDTKTRWSDLAARLEAAEGPDQDLWFRFNTMAYTDGLIDNRTFNQNQALIGYAHDWEAERILVAVALSWVPEGWFWQINDLADAVIGTHESFDKIVRHEGHANTPALALCIANARAIKAMES